MTSLEIQLANEQATEQLGARLGQACEQGAVIYLVGELGAGKTTLVRGLLLSQGHIGPVKSPTYTLVEGYELGGRHYYHFDLYRLGSPDELEYIGVRDYFADDHAVCLVEWPLRGRGVLPPPDVIVELRYHGEERLVRISCHTERGENIGQCVQVAMGEQTPDAPS